MRRGDIINGYTILEDFSVANGGLSKWTFARKGGEEFFLKEFLYPTYPVDGSPGSAETKNKKRKECERFELHHQSLVERIAPRCRPGGNLVYTRDFFRHEAKYYKTTDKVDISSLEI